MSLMLPSESASARSLVGVADDLFAALRGESELLPRATSVVLVLVDGLGAIGLRAHAGHARTLTGRMSKRDVAHSVFPSTTAAALTSLLTGAWPGEHGLVGYRVLDRSRDVLVNQLTGWESEGLDPATWQAAPTIFERARSEKRPAFAVGVAAYASSGFTRATLRGAEFVAASTPAERIETAYDLAERNPGSLVYCYLPEADKAGHRHGVASLEWVTALEEIDGALARRVPPGVGVIVTSDHGMVDVPAQRQVVLEAEHLRGVHAIGGEPRMLHVYLDHGQDVEEATSRWSRDLDGLADVGTRGAAIAAGFFGPSVSEDAASRIGDLLVVARGNGAVYDGTAPDQHNRGMIGQHGGITPEERQVPLIRFGAFAR